MSSAALFLGLASSTVSSTSISCFANTAGIAPPDTMYAILIAIIGLTILIRRGFFGRAKRY